MARCEPCRQPLSSTRGILGLIGLSAAIGGAVRESDKDLLAVKAIGLSLPVRSSASP